MANNFNSLAIIDVTPTLRTDEYAQNDVLFNKVEIPGAVVGNGGCSELINITVTSEKAAWKEIDVIIFDMLGNRIIDIQQVQKEIDISNLPNGVYNMTIIYNNKRINKRIVKQ